MSAPLLAAVGVSRKYQRGDEIVKAVDDVTLPLEAGKLYVLQGPSGSGKTTLLNVLAGWERQYEGRVEWRGEEIDPSRLGWSDLAVVPQRVGLLPELTAEENVTLAHRVRGNPGHDVSELFDSLKLEDLQEAFPDEMSAGQQQRVSIARSIACRPAAVLVDEPTSSQDEDHARLVLSELRRLAGDGAMVLVASHDPITPEYADAVLAMRDGRLL